MSVILISMYFVRISSKLLRRKLSCEFKLVKAPYSGSVPETIQNRRQASSKESQENEVESAVKLRQNKSTRKEVLKISSEASLVK